MARPSVAVSFWLIVGAALLLRIVGLNTQGFWNDEILTLKNSPMAWQPLLQALDKTESSKPPLYYLFMHQWLRGGDSEIWARLPSAIFGALTCGVFFLVTLRLLDFRGAWIAGLFLALSPFHLDYSQEARMYGLFGLEACLALFCLLRFFETRNNVWLLALGVCSVLLEYTFSYGFFFVGFAGLLLLIRWKELGLREGLALLVTLVISFAAFVPWLWRMVGVSGTAEGVQAYKGPPWSAVGYTFYALGYGFDLGPSTTDLQVMGSYYFRAHPAQTLLVLIALAVMLFILARGVWSLRTNRFLVAFTVGGLLIFLLGPAMISLLKPTVTDNPRYAFLALFPFGVMFAAGVRSLASDRPIFRAVAGLFALLLLSSLKNYYLNPAYGREDLRAASVYLTKLNPPPQAVVVCVNYLGIVVKHYYQGPAPVLGFLADGPADLPEQTATLQGELSGLKRFAVVYARPDHGDPQHLFLPWLNAHYHFVSETDFAGTQVEIFEAPAAGN